MDYIKKTAIWFDSLPESGKFISAMIFIAGGFTSIILFTLIVRAYIPDKGNWAVYQNCVDNNIMLENKVIEKNWENGQFKPYPCDTLLPSP